MTHSPLGRTLVIANPAAHSGRGAEGADFAERFLSSHASVTKGYELRLTASVGDATRLVADAGTFDTVVALGGDGVIHEVACGLMGIPASDRPQLGVIPLGSGNDYARTLGMARNNVSAAFAQLVQGTARPVEVGRVNGTHFVQTLSFGLDAAIALDTTERRAQGDAQEGEALFATSALKILSRASGGFPCTVSFDGSEPRALSEIIFAVQVGPTYGGGFRICPEASPSDGLLDACFNTRIPSVPRILALMGLARWGLHARSSVMAVTRIRHAEIVFAEEPPCQVDGEPLRGTRFSVDVVPEALRVIFPR